MPDEVQQPQPQEGDVIGRDEFRRVVGQRQKLKARLRELQAERGRLLRRIEQLQAESPPEAGGALTPEEAAAIKRMRLAKEAADAGAFNGDQVAVLLADRARLDRTGSGDFTLTMLGEDGDVAVGPGGRAAGAESVMTDFLCQPENTNLARPDARPLLEARRRENEQIEQLRRSPPRSVEALARYSPRVREAVLDAMTPQQRTAVLKPDHGRFL